MRKIASMLLFILPATAALGQTANCGIAPNRVTPIVSATVDKRSDGVFEYRYTLANGAGSQQSIIDFVVDIVSPITNVVNPPGWTHGQMRKMSALHWAATAPDPAATPDSAGLRPALAKIKPNTSLAGFAFTSAKPPGPAVFYVRGEVPTTVYSSEEEAELASEECPRNDIISQSLKGLTQGPVDFTPVGVIVKPTAKAPAPVNPTERGVIPVAVLSGAGFDAAQIDRSSVTLGAKGTHAVNEAGDLQDVNGDGSKDLVLHFPAPQVGVQCGDTFLFLRGSTVDGKQFGGAEAIQTVGCKQ